MVEHTFNFRPIMPMPMNELKRKSLEQIVEECARYPLEAFEFVRQGLNYTMEQLQSDAPESETSRRHISGQQLCRGLRGYAICRYGFMAKAVLHHWQIRRTEDFGRIVFAMVENRLMHKTDDDDIHDFDSVYDFGHAFDPACNAPEMLCK